MFPEYTRTERLADAAIHVLGLGASLGGAAALLRAAAVREAPAMAGAAVYAVGLVAMFALSAAYNLASRPDRKEALRRYDHAAIFLMIAGTYTPFALVGLRGPLGDALLAAVWLAAAAGMAFKLLRPRRFERASVFVYLALGWIGLPAAGALAAALPQPVMVLLGAGGILYTLGVALHLRDTLPLQNALWHAAVLAAAGCHYAAVYQVIAGP